MHRCCAAGKPEREDADVNLADAGKRTCIQVVPDEQQGPSLFYRAYLGGRRYRLEPCAPDVCTRSPVLGEMLRLSEAGCTTSFELPV
jgi:hypothetical protein